MSSEIDSLTTEVLDLRQTVKKLMTGASTLQGRVMNAHIERSLMDMIAMAKTQLEKPYPRKAS